MACHTPSLKKAKKQGEMPLPSLGPIPSLNSTGLRVVSIIVVAIEGVMINVSRSWSISCQSAFLNTPVMQEKFALLWIYSMHNAIQYKHVRICTYFLSV